MNKMFVQVTGNLHLNFFFLAWIRKTRKTPPTMEVRIHKNNIQIACVYNAVFLNWEFLLLGIHEASE